MYAVSGAFVKTLPRHCAAPYFVVINRLFLPMYPRPLSMAIVLCGSIDVFVEKSNVFSAINPVSDCEIALNPLQNK